MKLKKTLAAAAVAVTALAGYAQENIELRDTLMTVDNPTHIIVTSGPADSRLTIDGTKSNPDFYYSFYTDLTTPKDASLINDETWGLKLPFLSDHRRRHVEAVWFDQIYVGVTMPTSFGLRNLDAGVEAGVGNIAGIKWNIGRRGPSLTLGFGLFTNSVNVHGAQIMSRDGRMLSVADAPEGATDVSGRINNFGLQIPLTFTQSISNSFGISLGAAMKFNTYTTAHSTWTEGNTTYKRSIKGLHQRPLTFQLYGAIGWSDVVGLYVRYTPVSLFDKSFGPKFETISFGLTFGI